MKNCTRFFTQEQIDEIRVRLAAINGAKDSEFESALPIEGTEKVAIIQNGRNKLLDIKDLRQDIGVLDSEPTPNSYNAVTSNGIYHYIQDIIDNIPSAGDSYLYIESSSEMFDYLINYGTSSGSQYQQSVYDYYCNLVLDAVQNKSLIVIDNAICLTNVVSDPVSFSLQCISNSKYITLGAIQNNDETWRILPGTGVSTARFLIDNRYLTTQLANYLTITSFNNKIDSTPTNGSSNLVTSGGVASQLYRLENIMRGVSNSLQEFIEEYNERMEQTPKYHKLNWLTDEKEPGSEDAQGGYSITDDSSQATAIERFRSLWYAIRDSYDGNKVSKMILYYSIPIVYAQTDNLSSVDQATKIVIRFYDGQDVRSFVISKRTQNDEIYLHVLPVITNVDNPDDTIDPTPDPEPETDPDSETVEP